VTPTVQPDAASLKSSLGLIARAARAGEVQTVLGPIRPDELGLTLTHEHLACDASALMIPPEEATRRAKFNEPLSIGLLGLIRYTGLPNLDNARLQDVQTSIEEASLFKQAGGGTIVDVTSVGLGRDPVALASIARASRLNVVMGCSYYVDAAHPKDMSSRSEQQIADEIVREIREGVGTTGIKAGIIGEVGCSMPITDNERKVLRASARAQRATGVPISIHPGRYERAPLEIIEVLDKAGADLSRTIMCHLDRTLFDRTLMKELAATGCALEYDLFGQEHSFYRPAPHIDMPNDAQRLNWLAWLIENGYGQQLVVSQDIDAKYLLLRYGGSGYAHIVNNIVPRMRRKGFDEAIIYSILVGTPRRLMTLVEPRGN
jgi:phosphotriesterase-related protein